MEIIACRIVKYLDSDHIYWNDVDRMRMMLGIQGIKTEAFKATVFMYGFLKVEGAEQKFCLVSRYLKIRDYILK